MKWLILFFSLLIFEEITLSHTIALQLTPHYTSYINSTLNIESDN